MVSNMAWLVELTHNTVKQRKKLPIKTQTQFDLLAKEIEILGPMRNKWSNFGVLRKSRTVPSNSFHCHIKSGRPTYVVCWRVIDKSKKIVEIYYVGTHEKAPY